MRNIQQSIDAVTLHKPWLKHINGDVFDISRRIRHIDSGYFIVWNARRSKFEVHNVDTYPNTYELTVPYSELDSRTLDFCMETRVANAEKILKQLEADNRKLEETAKRDRRNMIEDRAIELAHDLRRATE